MMRDRSPKELFQIANQMREETRDLFNNDRPAILKRTIELYKMAASRGHVESMYLFAKLTLDNYRFAFFKPQEAIQFLKRAAESGHNKAQQDVLRYYHECGKAYGIQPNEAIKIAALMDPVNHSKKRF